MVSAALAAVLALPVVFATSDAHADRYRVRVGGQARVRIGGPSVRVRYRAPRVYGPGVRVRYRPYYRPYRYRTWSVGGHVSGGLYYGSAVYYADPPPPPPPRCYEGCGPVVYSTPAPAPVAYVEPPLPRLGIGVFAGSMDVEGQEIGSDVGLLGRLRLTNHFQLEAEFAKSEIADSTRVDRRIGAAAIYDFSPRSTFSPFVLAGLGFSQTEIGDDEFSTEQGYGELGVGLTWNLSRHLAISGDLRAGQRESSDDDVALLATMPQPLPMEEDEAFTRARLSAILFF
jgi:hypothetical protein